MKKEGVLILECLKESDPGSEGKFLAHMFNIMDVKHQYIEVENSYQFLVLLRKSPYKIIHIATHGSLSKENKFIGLWMKQSIVDVKKINILKNSLKDCTIVITACKSGDLRFLNQFIEITSCEFLIAPIGSPTFYNSIFFCHVFYHKLFILKKEIKKILFEYDKRYKNPHGFFQISYDEFWYKMINNKLMTIKKKLK